MEIKDLKRKMKNYNLKLKIFSFVLETAMIKRRLLTIAIVLGFLMPILFSAVLSFAEQMTFTTYFPSPNNIYYNGLNATALSVDDHFQVGNSLGVGQYVADADSDIHIVKTDGPANLMLFGQGDEDSPHAQVRLLSNGYFPSIDDYNVWEMDHNIDDNLVFLHHTSGIPGNKQVLTLNTTGRVGLNTPNPQANLHITSPQRDLIRLNNPGELNIETGMIFHNTHADMDQDQYFGLLWKNRIFMFWHATSLSSMITTDNVIMALRIQDWYKSLSIGTSVSGWALNVDGGARFNLSAEEEDFVVLDSSKGVVDEIVWYDYDEGKIYLGNKDATKPISWWDPDPPEVYVNNLTVEEKLTAPVSKFWDASANSLDVDTIEDFNTVNSFESTTNTGELYPGNFRCQICVDVEASDPAYAGQCGNSVCFGYGDSWWDPWLTDNTGDSEGWYCKYRFKFSCEEAPPPE